MTSQEIASITREANAIGAKGNLVCRYQRSRKWGLFEWAFYRNGVFVGATNKREKVLDKATALATCK